MFRDPKRAETILEADKMIKYISIATDWQASDSMPLMLAATAEHDLGTIPFGSRDLADDGFCYVES